MDCPRESEQRLETLTMTKPLILPHRRRRLPWSKDEQKEHVSNTPPETTATPTDPFILLCKHCSKLDLESMLARETIEQEIGLLSSFMVPDCPFCGLISKSIGLAWGLDWNTQKLSSALGRTPNLFMQSRSPLRVKARGRVEHPQPRLLLAVDMIPPELERPILVINKEVTKIQDRHIIAEIECLPGAVAALPTAEKPCLVRREVKPIADITLVKQWLAECKTHKHSKMSKAQTGSDSLFQGPGFRLIDVENECLVRKTSRCDYAALSYVWGALPTVLDRDNSSDKTPILLTLKYNIERLSTTKGLSTASVAEHENARIPVTVQDAMEFTRKIGMRYRWVDTLCIVQNDLEDKGRLIGSMDDVYADAAVTFIAAAGIDADAGLKGVRRRSGSAISPTTVSRRSGKGNLNLSTCLTSLSEEVRKSRWHTRGWTFQEQALSRRCLYFTANEIYFNCSQAQFREGYVVDASKGCVELRTGPPWWTRNLRKDPDPTPYHYLGDIDALGPQEYQTAVQDYMRKNLTYPDDILEAFEGVFNRFSGADRGTRPTIRETQGIPAHLIHLGLLWFPSEEAKKRPDLTKPPNESLPQFSSWSWTSRIGPVEFVFAENRWLSRNISFALRERLPIHVPILCWHVGGHNEWSPEIWKAAYAGKRTSDSKLESELSLTKSYLTERIGVDISKLQGQSVRKAPSDLRCGELRFFGPYLSKEKVNLRTSKGRRVATISTSGHKGEFRFDDDARHVDELILMVSADTIQKRPKTQSTLLGVSTQGGISRRVGIGYIYHSEDRSSVKPKWEYKYFRLW
ncbi:hypothetical protein CEP53_008232 [Fusarium sp. AF-6]|nr:hypothetical protein CEP53_008232 [Fusarium sp. AF-6]